MGNQGLCTLVIGGLIGLLQILPALLGCLGLLEGLSKACNRNVVVPSLAFVVLLQQQECSSTQFCFCNIDCKYA